jgi:hypothetical protein
VGKNFAVLDIFSMGYFRDPLHNLFSNIKFGFGVGILCIFHEKLPKDGKVLCHLGLKSKILAGSLTDISA